MTYEATKIELYGANNDGNPIGYTYSGTAFCLKGTLLAISGATNGQRIVSRALTHLEGAPIAGIASADASGLYVLGVDFPRVGVWTQGIFQMQCSGACTAGAPIASVSEVGSANWVMVCPSVNAGSGGAVVLGYAVGVGVAQGNIGYLTPVRLNL